MAEEPKDPKIEDSTQLDLVPTEDMVRELASRFDCIVIGALRAYRPESYGRIVMVKGNTIIAKGLIGTLEERNQILQRPLHLEAELSIQDVIDEMIVEDDDEDDDGSDENVPAGDGG